MTPCALPAELLYRRCDPERLPFATTSDLEPLDEPLGQNRAVAAVRFAIGMRADGYNLFALGPEGTGKLSMVRRFLERAAAQGYVPDDWCYVNNFVEPHKPHALRLPAGMAHELRRDVDRLIEELAAVLPAAFETDEYRSRRQKIDEHIKEQQESALREVQRRAAERQIVLVRAPLGWALAPIRDGEVLSPEEYQKLPENERAQRHADLEEMQQLLEEQLQAIPRWQRQQRDLVRELDQEMAAQAVARALEDLVARYEGLPAVLDHLSALRRDVIDNFDLFLEVAAEGDKPALRPKSTLADGPFRRYRVNVLVGNQARQGAPVVYEDYPTQPNLIGRVEHIAQFGALVTDFNLIKPGALHRANGGYLIIDARKLLTQPFAYDDLKRALKAREIRIEAPYQALGLMSTVSLEPEPIPLDVKVVLIGEPMLYYLLSHYDPDFPELFKVEADFDYRMERSAANVLGLARLLAGVARREGLRPFAQGAVARLEEQAARLAGDTEKLTSHVASLLDVAREADYWAREARADIVDAAHVQQAIDAKTYRSDRVREYVQDEIWRRTFFIDTEGAVVGQINGLSVMQLGRFTFGRPSRITCRVSLGKGEVVDIEREVQLGGPLHSKGVLILSGFLNARFGGDQPLSLAASLVFEQSYSGVDGDSASSTELYALLSALADLPIRQGLAVTGSVNQHGEIQPIGGVNEKVEGFFDVCRVRGLTGDQGVLIPAANVKHLMLRSDVVAACAEKRFHIYPVTTIDQGIELLTGVPAGEPDAKGEYPLGSVNRRVATRLAAFGRKARALAAQMGRGTEV